MIKPAFSLLLAGAGLVSLATSGFADTPVIYWTFDNTGNDTMGTLNGTLNGNASFAAGGVPAALGFSTHSLDLNAGNTNTGFFSADSISTTVSGTYTVSLWAQARDLTGDRSFFSTRSGSDQSFDAKFSNGTTIHGDIGNGGGWINTSADGIFAAAANAWTHVAYVVKPTGYQVFANGMEIGHGTFAANTPLLIDPTHDVAIGRYNGGGEDFNGRIDDVAVYSTALTPKQVAQLTAGTQPTALAATAAGRSYHGALDFTPVTNDADSGISAGKTYTHKLDFGTSGTATVNGVAFSQGNVGGGAGQNYATTIPNQHPGNGTSNTSGNVAGVFQDMVFGDANGITTLGGLTPGQSYTTRLFVRNWADPGQTFDRTQAVEFDTDGDGIPERRLQINPDDPRQKGSLFSGDHQAYTLDYTFVADSPNLRINTRQLGGGSYHLYGITNEQTNRVPIKLYNTGMDNNGNPLPVGSPDSHYILTSAPQGTTALAITNHPAWGPNDLNSQFVGVVEPGATDVAVGLYSYSMNFDLTGLDPATAQVDLTLFADNDLNVWLNGVDTGINHSGFAVGSTGSFTLSTGFQPGLNTFEFRLTNGGGAPNPGGFMAQLNGTALPIPEPGAALLGVLGISGLLLRRRR